MNFPASPYVEQMEEGIVYVVTTQGPKIKRTITGKLATRTLTEVILLDEKGRFRKAPIDKIIRINFYYPDRAPF